MKYKYIIIILTVLLLSGCSISFKDSSSKGNSGGIFLSSNKGDRWQSASYLQTINENKTISSLNTNNIVIDPNDSSAIYLASTANGLFYAYDIRLGWRRALGLPNTGVNDIAINPNTKCTIYVSAGNKVFKSIDCNRTWSQIYHDDQSTAIIHTVAIDHYNNQNIYIGTNRGEILQSNDGGESWKVITNLEDNLLSINIDSHDSRILFARTKNQGLFRSMDGGKNWSSLAKTTMNEFKNKNKIKSLSFGKKDKGLVIITTSYGMLKSTDYGNNWDRIKLITPKEKTQINDTAIDPTDSNKIYYVTNSNLYRTNDGGNTWTMRDLPTQRRGIKIIINPDNTNLIYLGVLEEEKKGIF